MRLVDGRVRPAAEVEEGAVAVHRDVVHALVADQVLDQLDLVVLALAREVVERLAGGPLAALERLVGLDVLAHLLLDARQVVLGEAHALGEVEVVVEAVLDRGPDRDLGARPQLGDRLGHHVRGVVADEPQAVVVAGGGDLDARAVGQRRVEVAQLAVHLDRPAPPGPGPSRWPPRRRPRWRPRGAPAGCRRGGGPSCAQGIRQQAELSLERAGHQVALAHVLAAGAAHLHRGARVVTSSTRRSAVCSGPSVR